MLFCMLRLSVLVLSTKDKHHIKWHIHSWDWQGGWIRRWKFPSHSRFTCRSCVSASCGLSPGQWGKQLQYSKWDTEQGPLGQRRVQQYLLRHYQKKHVIYVFSTQVLTVIRTIKELRNNSAHFSTHIPTVMSWSMPAMMRVHSSSRLPPPHSSACGLCRMSALSSSVTGTHPPTASGRWTT